MYATFYIKILHWIYHKASPHKTSHFNAKCYKVSQSVKISFFSISECDTETPDCRAWNGAHLATCVTATTSPSRIPSSKHRNRSSSKILPSTTESCQPIPISDSQRSTKNWNTSAGKNRAEQQTFRVIVRKIVSQISYPTTTPGWSSSPATTTKAATTSTPTSCPASTRHGSSSWRKAHSIRRGMTSGGCAGKQIPELLSCWR